MHGSIWPVAILPLHTPSPSSNSRVKSSLLGKRVGNCLQQSCPGGKGWGNELLLDFVKYVLFRVQFAQWLQTARLHIFRGKCSNLSESVWRGITYPYQNWSLYLKVCFKFSNECLFDAYSNEFFCKRNKEIFISPS